MTKLSVFESTALLSSFIMGAELLLLIVYIRPQLVMVMKNFIYTAVEKELLREGYPLGDSPPFLRPNFSDLYSSLNFEQHTSNTHLVSMTYVLIAVLFLALMLFRIPGPVAVNTVSAVTAGLLGLTVFLVSQWGFLKAAILPHYVALYNKFTGQNMQSYMHDDTKTTLVLFSPAIVALAGFVAMAAAAWINIDWGFVWVSGLIAMVSLGTEVLSWMLLKAYSIPVSEMISDVTDAATAILWVNSKNTPQQALKKLHQAIFPTDERNYTAKNALSVVFDSLIVTRILEVNSYGDLEVVRVAVDTRVRSLVMLSCALLLMCLPFLIVAVRADPMDAILVYFDGAVVAAAYIIYMFHSGNTETIRSLVNTLQDKISG